MNDIDLIAVTDEFLKMDNEDDKIDAVEVFAPLEKLDIYLPREDDREPHYPAAVSDPLFTANHIYKYSDQILQDRQLFVSKKDTSRSLFSSLTDSTEEFGNSTARSQCSDDKEKTDRTTTASLITLKLDSIAPSPTRRKPRRFNEPLNGYIATKKRLQFVKNCERELLNSTIMSSVKILSLQQRESQGNRNLVRTLGLPPIQNADAPNVRAVESWPRMSLMRSQTTVPSYSQMPARLSWKPHAIWKQPIDVHPARHNQSIDGVNIHTLRSAYDKYIRREYTVL